LRQESFEERILKSSVGVGIRGRRWVSRVACSRRRIHPHYDASSRFGIERRTRRRWYSATDGTAAGSAPNAESASGGSAAEIQKLPKLFLGKETQHWRATIIARKEW